jgi:RimJ/RimL family protein N-acetyltransferase
MSLQGALMPNIHLQAGQVVGRDVDSRPAQRPDAVTLPGRYGAVERLNASKHGASLWDAVRGHDKLWAYMAYGPFADEGAFSGWLASRAALVDPYYYAIVEPSGCAVGLAALMSIRPEMRVVEVGNILLGPSLQRTALATEAQYLLARYAFEVLRYRRYEWKCDALNAASRRAALRFGFSFEGIFRDHMIIKGRSRDTAWFAMLEGEWPARKAAFERWLAPVNFAADGTQKKKLGELHGAGD